MKFSVGFVLAATAVTTVHAGNSIMHETLSSESASNLALSTPDSSEISDLNASCSFACLAVMKPVTDEDGNTYSNACEMKKAKCMRKKRPAADSSEASDLNTSCSFACLAVMKPVTDEDGNTYSNECMMQKAKCKGKKTGNILEEYERLYGKPFGAPRDDDADESASEESDSNDEDDPPSEEGDSLSASNQIVQSALDEDLEDSDDSESEASESTKLVKSSKGPDKATKSTKTKTLVSETGMVTLYEDVTEAVIEDETSSTECATSCPNVELFVCGSDGIEYSNPCELKIAACKNPELNIVEDDAACTSSEVVTQDDTTV